jgi:hypothetical protein
MNDDIEKKAIESAGLALWQAYCEKKEELEDALYLIERLENEIVTLKLELDLATGKPSDDSLLEQYQRGLNRG